MTTDKLKEYNDFVGKNIIRNNFLPILQKLTSLPNSNLDISDLEENIGEVCTESINIIEKIK